MLFFFSLTPSAVVLRAPQITINRKISCLTSHISRCGCALHMTHSTQQWGSSARLDAIAGRDMRCAVCTIAGWPMAEWATVTDIWIGDNSVTFVHAYVALPARHDMFECVMRNRKDGTASGKEREREQTIGRKRIKTMFCSIINNSYACFFSGFNKTFDII